MSIQKKGGDVPGSVDIKPGIPAAAGLAGNAGAGLKDAGPVGFFGKNPSPAVAGLTGGAGLTSSAMAEQVAAQAAAPTPKEIYNEIIKHYRDTGRIGELEPPTKPDVPVKPRNAMQRIGDDIGGGYKWVQNKLGLGNTAMAGVTAGTAGLGAYGAYRALKKKKKPSDEDLLKESSIKLAAFLGKKAANFVKPVPSVVKLVTNYAKK